MKHHKSSHIPASQIVKLAALLELVGSADSSKRDQAISEASKLLASHNLSWSDVLALPIEPRREPHHGVGRKVCEQLLLRPDLLREWEKSFVGDLPAFRRISTRQRYVLKTIADRVTGEQA